MAIKVNMDLVRASFIEDAQEHLSELEKALIDLEKDPLHDEAIHTAFRSVHTLKGSAGIFKYDELTRFAHSLENMLDAVRDHALRISPEIVALLFKSYDHLQALLNFYTKPDQQESVSSLAQVSQILMLRINQLKAEKAAAAPAEKSAAVFTISCRPDLFRAGLSLENSFRYLLGHAAVRYIRVVPGAVPGGVAFDPLSAYLKFEVCFETTTGAEAGQQALQDAFEFLLGELMIESVAQAPGTTAESRDVDAAEHQNRNIAKSGKSIRVDSGKLDDFVNLVGELVMKNGSLMQLARSRESREFLRPIAEMSRLVEAVREIAMNLRMVPIGSTFRKMERLVRDVAAQTGKQVDLAFHGEETELDKNIIEKINDPLVHIIRNAIDHGIESPQEREAAGKARAGKILLNAYHEAGTIVIEIRDDGRGLAYSRILAKAKEKGLAEHGREYSEAEIQHFLFQPGFSTAETVSELSGRGVGMDVVKKNIDALRGSIRIASEAGNGMSLKIALPLTLAIIDGFLVRSGTQKFVIPLEAIKECVDFRAAAEAKTEHDSDLYSLRGEALPYLRLADVFGIVADGSEKERESLVVIQHGESRFGLVIDEPLGEYQTVIKPLTGFLAGIPGIGGATILGTRDMALILDMTGLLDLVIKKKGNRDRQLAEAL